MSLQVAKTILEQIGGNRFLVCTGAKDLFYTDDGLVFKLPRYRHTKINCVEISLNDKDLYNIRFSNWNIRKFELTEISNFKDVFCEDLKNVFCEETKLSIDIQ